MSVHHPNTHPLSLSTIRRNQSVCVHGFSLLPGSTLWKKSSQVFYLSQTLRLSLIVLSFLIVVYQLLAPTCPSHFIPTLNVQPQAAKRNVYLYCLQIYMHV